MHTLGLIGGIGSGKSAVAALFGRLGAGVVDADRIGHRVLRFPEIKEKAVARWGNGVVEPSGELDRKAIANIVFAPTDAGRRELDFLTALTHPPIKREIETEFRRLELADKPLAVLDAALLLESGWKSHVEKIVFVDVPRNVRLERVLRRGWTEAQFDAREAAQLPLDFKKSEADWIIDNSGNLSETLDKIMFIWQNALIR